VVKNVGHVTHGGHVSFQGRGGMMVKRSVAAALTVVMAAAVNVTTGMLTQHWGWAWLAATIVLVTVGAVSQV
jgi:hypothetical protein